MSSLESFFEKQHEKKEWLDSLKVGDTVAVESRGYTLVKIEKITKTRRFTTSAGHVYRADGSAFGTYLGGNLVKPTKAIYQEIRRQKMLSRVRSAEFSKLDNETLEKVYNLIYPNKIAKSDKEGE